ncbi:MAG: M15 family metallopeptidase [Culicoidibacterales bacterium]
MQLSSFARRILQFLIVILIITAIVTSISTAQPTEKKHISIAPDKLEMSNVCDQNNLTNSLKNYNCSLFFLSPNSPKQPLDQSFMLDSNNARILEDKYFVNPTLHLQENWIHKDIEAPLKEMVAAANAEKIDLKIFSALRLIETQKSYSNSLKVPAGRDENQTGFALDFTMAKSSGAVFQVEFSQSAEGQWLANNSYKFGFVLRYPKDKEAITHVQFSPWHYRYFGKEIAKEMFDNKWTYEEWLKSKGAQFEA